MLESPAEEYSNQHHQGGGGGGHSQPLYTEKIFSDRKIFFMDLKENDRGRFVKITEDVRGRRDTIMLPVEALGEFLDALNRVADFDDDLEEASPTSDES
jgi:hypothetical protein